MIDIKFNRLKEIPMGCDGCSDEIKLEQPYFEIYLDMLGQCIFLCEDCGNSLQNDMSDEYSKFVGLGL